MQRHKKFIYLSLLVTFGIVLHVFESMLPPPFPVPGAKLGLANIISLLTITLYGLKEGLIVNILRCLLGSLMGGSISSLLYSLSGALMSTLVMAFVYKNYGRIFSIVGISILGGVVHNIVQVTVASLILSTVSIYIYLPFLMVIGLFTGYFTGLVCAFVQHILNSNHFLFSFQGEDDVNEAKQS